jgi:hypothetical protein
MFYFINNGCGHITNALQQKISFFQLLLMICEALLHQW